MPRRRWPIRDELTKAESAEASGDLPVARQLWQGLAIRSGEASYYLRWASVAEELRLWEEAEQAFQKAAELVPSEPEALEALGHLHLAREDTPIEEGLHKARQFFRDAAVIGPSARVYAALGATELRLGNTEASKEAFTRALSLDSSYEEALVGLAELEMDHNTASAIEHLERALESDRDYFRAHQKLGVAYHKTRDLDRAEYHFRRSVEIRPGDFWSLLYLGNLFHIKGELNSAEECARKALLIQPDERAAQDLLTRIERAMENRERAGGPGQGAGGPGQRR